MVFSGYQRGDTSLVAHESSLRALLMGHATVRIAVGPLKSREMLRRLRNVACVISGVLLAATVVLWVRSFWIYDVVGYEAYSGVGTETMSVSGRLIFYHFNNYTRDPPPQQWGFSQISSSSREGRGMAREYDFSSASHWWNRIGFVAVTRPAFGPGTSFVVLAMPHWFAAALLAIVPSVYAFRRHRLRLADQRRLGGRCVACGYDLRGSPSRCPECGRPVTDRAAT